MFNLQRVLRFWRRLLVRLVPLYGGLLLLALLATWVRSTPLSGWQWLVALIVSLIPATMAIIAASVLSIAFLRDLYKLQGRREAFWHLVHCLCGQASFKPWLMIEQGRLNPQFGAPDSFLAAVGGPGNLVIRKDSAVVLERMGRLSRVEGPGYPHLEPFERVYDIIDLRPRRWQFAVSGLSKEGIPVTCDTDINFQIQDGGQQPSSDRPFPMDPNAVFTAATSKWIREADRPEGERVIDWKGHIVVSATEGTLRFILARYPLDRLIAPEKEGEEHPRQAIRRELKEALDEAAAKVGAKILEVQLGEIRVEDEVTQQWIERWRANWDRWESEYLAASEAAYLETVGAARSEAVVRRICDAANVLQAIRKEDGEDAFIAAAKLQLALAMRKVGADSLALTYMPAEAMKLLRETANLQLGPGAPQAGSGAP